MVELEDQLREQRVILTAMLGDPEKGIVGSHETAMDAMVSELRAAGYYDEANYGPLELYVGLKRLHNPTIPENATEQQAERLKLEGEAARDFSHGLWLIIILFELSPVLVTFLGAPFSHLSMRMRAKRDEARRKDMTERLEKEHPLLDKLAEARIHKARTSETTKSAIIKLRIEEKIRRAEHSTSLKKAVAATKLSEYKAVGSIRAEQWQDRMSRWHSAALSRIRRRQERKRARGIDEATEDAKREAEFLKWKMENDRKKAAQEDWEEAGKRQRQNGGIS